jgi:hypothetical protein
MKKQYIIPLVFLLSGIAITIIGALFKIMHWPGATILLSLGLLAEACAIIIIIIAALKRMK